MIIDPRGLLVSLAMAASVFAPSPAEACGCMAPLESTRESRMREIRRAWQFADIVFVGTFVSRDVTSSTLTVEKMWKGVSVEHATMREKTLLPDGLLTMSSCTQTFSSGRHLVFARQVDEGQWESGNCGPGGFAESRVEAIEFLDALCRDERLCALPVVDPSPPANADPDRRQ